ncbi:SDR family oxidoreductase [Nonomuraea jabiensis]|uniref:NADP-dependent 3-hydroxy acid dehydrogenase YdfG n=1 Tax=Nonomuraea jabiensis TaxID=882448 RepID=A0A7W9GK87_9ACTN|nr:SDR family NAD(P)-dependent oxidoreductase [Nonomuraea jabiensis]MBB5785319.1 NADP-dependent 3-hydroxy acid dehydrogenase YdfG [Nonomuraea jabiensis]
MKIAIIGAGPGIGLAVARRFGQEGFEVCLVSRDQDRLAALAAQLAGVRVTTHAADLTDERSLEAALADIGPVDVLVYNGAGAVRALTPVLEVTRESAQDAFDSAVLGAVTAVRAVLPPMLARGSGTLLFTSGISAVHPLPFLGNVGIAVSGLRNYALSLAEALAGRGVHVGHVPISAAVAPGSPASPEAVAETHWRLHTARDLHEVVLGDLATVEAAISAL